MYSGSWCTPCSNAGITLNLLKTTATTLFICKKAISFPKQILGPAWNTGYVYESLPTNFHDDDFKFEFSSSFCSHLSSLNSAHSDPHSVSNLPIAYGKYDTLIPFFTTVPPGNSSSFTASFVSIGTGGYSRMLSHREACVYIMSFTSSYIGASDFSYISFRISDSISGFFDKSQKNHVKAADVVSRPASMKLITMSITKFSSEWPELKNLDNRSTESRLCFSPSSCFFSFIIFMANSRISETAILRRFSEPIFNNFLIFHMTGSNASNLSLLYLTPSSNAKASLACGREGNKYAGSNPKAILHILSKANL